MNYQQAKQKLTQAGQEQILRFYGELSTKEQEELLAQIDALDFSPQELITPSGEIAPISGLGIGEIAKNRGEFYSLGSRALKQGKLAAVLLAGGQGTRLGSSSPKGAYDIGLTRPVYIFERLIENLKAVCKDCGAFVPLYIMTSDKNDEETQAFFKKHVYFGYPQKDIMFFKQAMAPCTDENGKILLEEKGKIALSPNGNGGWYASMEKAGALADAEKRGVEWFNVFAVDNVLQRIADPVFLGATIKSGFLCGAKVVRKTNPDERVGVLCLHGGIPDIVEYYEMKEEMANARRADGELLYGDGVILNYLFRADRLKEIARRQIPVHKVKKKVSYLDEEGNLIVPQTENAYKHETLILDMVRLMETCLPFEVEREKEFAPIKNLSGLDSVESARLLLQKNGVEL